MNFKKIMVAVALLALPIVSVSAKKASALEKNAFCVVYIEIDNEVNGKMIHQITKGNIDQLKIKHPQHGLVALKDIATYTNKEDAFRIGFASVKEKEHNFVIVSLVVKRDKVNGGCKEKSLDQYYGFQWEKTFKYNFKGIDHEVTLDTRSPVIFYSEIISFTAPEESWWEKTKSTVESWFE
jgi:hypothetical protein